MLKSLHPGPYLGQITSGKWVGAQNEKRPNRDMQNYFEISKQPVSLNKTKVKQMTHVDKSYISYSQTFPQRKFMSQKIFSSC